MSIKMPRFTRSKHLNVDTENSILLASLPLYTLCMAGCTTYYIYSVTVGISISYTYVVTQN